MSKLPDIILEASPHNFHISKNDMNDPDQDIRSPEDYVNRAIKAWMEEVTTPLERNQQPQAWERYPAHFGNKIVVENDWFPSSLPIGYVLMCFFISVSPKTVRLATLKRIFNLWVSNQAVRKDLFACYRNGKMFTQPVEVEVDETPDGIETTSILYGNAQASLFESGQ